MCFKTVEYKASTCTKVMKFKLCPRMHHFNNHTRKEIGDYYKKRKKNPNTQRREKQPPSSIYLSKTQQITINYTSSEVQPLHKNLQLNKPHLFTLKTKVNGHEIKSLVDVDSDYTLISNSLIKKLKTQHH